ncbi:MAG: hypothetical protein JO127_04810 [Caulobacteraceae bacterium]|nr:hypothetical protein [Caulobacteraceae bacterium]
MDELESSIALEIMWAAIRANLEGLSPKNRVAFLHRVSDLLDEESPIPIGRTLVSLKVRRAAAELWRRRLPSFLAP